MISSIKNFAELLIEEIKKANPSLSVSETEVVKQNGVVMTGLVISEKNASCAPTIYLEEYYERYIEGEALEKIREDVFFSYERACLTEPVGLPNFHDYEAIKSSLLLKMLNLDRCEEYLKDKIYIPFGNLAAVPYISLSLGYNTGSITVTKHLADDWLKTAEEIVEDALDNTCEISDVTTIEETLRELSESGNCTLSEEDLASVILDPNIKKTPMFIISNKTHMYGAGVLPSLTFWSNITKKLNTNFYIIPSSINELIAVPDLGEDLGSELTSMCMTVNRTEVDPSEYLADTIYYYDKSRNQVVYALDKDSIVVSA